MIRNALLGEGLKSESEILRTDITILRPDIDILRSERADSMFSPPYIMPKGTNKRMKKMQYPPFKYVTFSCLWSGGLHLEEREPGLSSCSIWRQTSTHASLYLHTTQLTTLVLVGKRVQNVERDGWRTNCK